MVAKKRTTRRPIKRIDFGAIDTSQVNSFVRKISGWDRLPKALGIVHRYASELPGAPTPKPKDNFARHFIAAQTSNKSIESVVPADIAEVAVLFPFLSLVNWNETYGGSYEVLATLLSAAVGEANEDGEVKWSARSIRGYYSGRSPVPISFAWAALHVLSSEKKVNDLHLRTAGQLLTNLEVMPGGLQYAKRMTSGEAMLQYAKPATSREDASSPVDYYVEKGVRKQEDKFAREFTDEHKINDVERQILESPAAAVLLDFHRRKLDEGLDQFFTQMKLVLYFREAVVEVMKEPQRSWSVSEEIAHGEPVSPLSVFRESIAEEMRSPRLRKRESFSKKRNQYKTKPTDQIASMLTDIRHIAEVIRYRIIPKFELHAERARSSADPRIAEMWLDCVRLLKLLIAVS